MKRAVLRAFVRRVVSGTLALVVASSAGLSAVSPTFAAGLQREPSQVAAASSPATPSSKESSPTVVRELEASRTADSSTYLLSDGSFSAEIFTAPIHYKDAGGAWRDIDASLVPTGTLGTLHTKAADYEQTIAPDSVTDTPVTIRHGDWSVGMRLIGGVQSSVMALGDTADYPLAMTDTKLTYETGGNSTKDTLTLSSNAAPDTFTFFMSLDNLRIFADPTGGYMFYDSKNKPAGRIAPLFVFDSAKESAEAEVGSVCTSATMEITEAKGGAYVTYRVPRSWLDDPARVYPIKVDPETTWGGASVSADTFVSSNYPSSSFGSDSYLYTGWATVANGAPYTWNTVRTMLAFSLGSTIGQGATINAATLQLYCSKNTGASAVTANTITSGGWDGSSTWASTFGNGALTFIPGTSAETVPVVGTGYKCWNVTGPVQRWHNGSQISHGFMLNESSDGSSSNIFRRYTSSTGGDTTGQQPHLTINYTQPSITGVGFSKPSYKIGDEVTATVSVASRTDPANIQGVIKGSNGSAPRGRFLWTARDPGIEGYETFEAGPDSFFSFDKNVCWAPAGSVVPDLRRCTTSYNGVTRTVNFTYRIGDAYGDVQGNQLSGICFDYPSTQQYVNVGTPAAITPGIPSAAFTTNATAAWFAESDTNGDGLNDARNDTATSGRGSVALSWPAVPSVSGYNVYLFDGNTYRKVGTTTSTTWTTSGKGLYPTDTAISNLTADTTANPYLAGTGLDLRDDPKALWAKTAGTTLDGTPAYAFKVVPTNSTGEAPMSQIPAVTVALDGRTTHLNDDPRHTEHDLGSVLGSESSVRLDTGSLELSTVDLEVSSPGPDAALSRHYSSSSTSAKTLAPGWIFNFEQKLSVSGAVATYIDANGDSHRFTLVTKPVASATGGNKYVSGSNTVHVFNSSGSLAVDGAISNASALVVGGGGGGYANLAGGGGGGGVLTGTQNLVGTMPVTVGAGGAANSAKGSNSAFGIFTAIGGGDGASRDVVGQIAGTGGSGGGGAGVMATVPANRTGGAGTTGQGFAGGTGTAADQGANSGGGGGGGASGVGAAGGYRLGGKGGAGKLSSITGVATYYGGGGGGSSYYTAGVGGAGGGGRGQGGTGSGGSGSTAGTANTGGGGGGGSAGGSGIVVVSYPTPANTSAWTPPNGYYGKLTHTTSPAGWTLELKDRTKLAFTEAGVLLSETDGNGRATTYTWSGGTALAIRASNGQQIDITLASGGRVLSARHKPGGVERKVVYGADTGGGDTKVTCFSGTGGGTEYTVSYDYGTGTRLANVDLIRAGQSATEVMAGVPAHWSFAYGANGLSQVTVPGTVKAPQSTITIGRDPALRSATISRSAQVSGSDTTISETYRWNPTGTMASHADPKTPADPIALWSYAYSPANDPQCDISPTGKTAFRQYDSAGNVVLESDELGRATLSTYNTTNDLTRKVDPRGCATDYTYDTRGNLVREEKQLTDAGAKSCTRYTYDSSGRKTAEYQLLFEMTWLKTGYDYAGSPADEASTETKRQVTGLTTAPDPGTYPAQNIDMGQVTTISGVEIDRTFDEFGNKLTESLPHQPGGSTTPAVTNAYDPATKSTLLTSTDAAGVATKREYDVLGCETATYRSVSTTSTQADWKQSSVDPLGRAVTETYYGDSGVLDRTVTHAFDASGRETSSDDSRAFGTAHTHYDARGNTIAAWAEATNTTDLLQSTRNGYTSSGQLERSAAPGSPDVNATVYVNAANGNLLKQTEPDGSWTSWTYDEAGNKVSETQPASDGGDPSVSTFVFDRGGRQTRSISADGAVTNATYDLADRQITSGSEAGGANASKTVYNALGWTVSETDSDGITTTSAYDVAGRVVSEKKGADAPTTSTYDALGRVRVRVNPDGSVLENTYDAFGRIARELQRASAGGAVTKRVDSTYDALGRAKTQATYPSDAPTAPAKITRTFSYPTASDPRTVAGSTYGSMSATAVDDGEGLEVSRAAAWSGGSLTRTVTSRDAAKRETGWTLGTLSFGQHFDVSGRIDTQSGDGLTGSSETTTYAYANGATGKKVAEKLALSYGPQINSTFTYTDGGRLSKVTGAGAAAYLYDLAGNVEAVRIGETTTTLTYDSANRLADRRVAGSVAEVFTWDTAHGYRLSQGSAATPAAIAYTYTPAGRLATYKTVAGVDAVYTYDANGQRTRSVVSAGGPATTTDWTYEGLTLLSLKASNSTASWTIDYLYDGAGRPYAGVYRAGTAAPVPFAMVTTDRGDVIELLTISRQPFAAYRYDAWGKPVSATSQAAGSLSAGQAADIAARQPLRYAGYCYDGESGLYYLSARHYDPATMQFLTKDPAKADGEESAFQYCGADPVGKVDPSGRSFTTVKGFKRETQEKTQWCWAAAGVSVVRTLGKSANQTGFVKKAYGFAPNWPGSPMQIVQGIKGHGRKATWKFGRMGLDELKTHMKKNEPIIAGISWPTSHSLVIYAVCKDKGLVRVLDPADGSTMEMTRESLKRYNGGVWMTTTWGWR